MGNDYEAEFVISMASFALFRMTWHPNWAAYIDGKVKTVCCRRASSAWALLPGQRTILLRYEPGIWKLMIASQAADCAGRMAIERRGHLVRLTVRGRCGAGGQGKDDDQPATCGENGARDTRMFPEGAKSSFERL